MRVSCSSSIQYNFIFHDYLQLIYDDVLQINSRSIQDLQMFGDPLSVPVVLVERVINAPRRTCSGNSYLGHSDQKAPTNLLTELKTVNKLPGPDQRLNGRELKLVVFVHGFQVCLSYTRWYCMICVSFVACIVWIQCLFHTSLSLDFYQSPSLLTRAADFYHF